MNLCTDTITVFNKRVDDGSYVYYPTVIANVSWYGKVLTSVGDKGLIAENMYTIRVPIEADFGGKSYVNPVEYAGADSADGIFTFDIGDVVIKGEVSAPMTLAELRATHYEFCTVMRVTDNRRAPNAPHWKLVAD